MNRLAISILFIICSLSIKAQTFEAIQFPVLENGTAFKYPFAGGAQAPQFSQVDLNFDGKLDLFVFDRSGYVVSTYINIDNNYQYAPFLSDNMPRLREWALLKDYNSDGIPDLFTSPSTTVFDGIEVWTGKNENGVLSFELKKFDQFVHDGLFFAFGSSYFNIYAPTDDFPVIEDVDNDGDLDVISFGTGGSKIFYYQNQVLERGLPIDTFDFILADDCYGGVFESEVSEDLFLSETLNGCSQGFDKESEDDSKSGGAHAGSTLLITDGNNDGLMDLLIGDLTNTHMTMAYNGGNSNKAWFTSQDTRFPVYDEFIEIPFFLGSYTIDYDFDGDQDIIATCNRSVGVLNTDNVWLYERISTESDQPFRIVKKDYLVDEMLDFGENAAPVFVDVDQDGLMDIIVGSTGEYVTNTITNTSMVYIRNTGTQSAPQFEIVDRDWLGFSEFREFSTGIRPAFGDLDNDGDIDCLIGDRTGKLYYYENDAGPNQPFTFKNPIPEYKGIDIGNYAKPVLVDLDQDGLIDLLIGEEGTNTDNEDDTNRSSLNYFKNVGTSGSPDFNPDPEFSDNNPFIGNVITTTPFQSKAGCSPYLFKSNDETFLIIGSQSGEIDVYSNVLGNVNTPFTKTVDNLYDVHVGVRSNPALADINNDGFLEMLIGNERGGLNLFTTDIMSKSSSTEEEMISEKVRIFPNPVSDQLNVDSDTFWKAYSLFNIQGELIIRGLFKNKIDVQGVIPGLYILKLSDGDQQVFQKIIIE